MFNELNVAKRPSINKRIENLKDLPSAKISEYIGQTITPCGYYFANTKYGKWVYVVTDSAKIKLPVRYVEVFQAFTDDMTDAVINEKLSLVNIHEIECDNGSKSVAFDFADTI